MNFVQSLLDLQEIDDRIRNLEQEIKDIPMRKQEESKSLFLAQRKLDEARENAYIQETTVRASEAEIKALDERIEQLKADQGNLKTNAEFKDFNLQITKLTKDVENLKSHQQYKLDDLTLVKGRVAEAEAALLAEKSEIDGYLSELDSRMAEVKEELEKTEAERRAFIQTLAPAQLSQLAYYDRIRSRRWPAVVSLSAEGACNGCHLVQTPSVAQNVIRNQNIVTCDICGRILYREV